MHGINYFHGFYIKCALKISRRIILLGDLNYRLNLSYEMTHELISKQDWDRMFKVDQVIQISKYMHYLHRVSSSYFFPWQLKKELGKGCTFDGWVEGPIIFPPTYKYEFNSEKYVSDATKSGRRTPAWYAPPFVYEIHSSSCNHSTRHQTWGYVYRNKEINILTCLYRCDRILSYGKGTRLLSYKRAELMLSDHRPVTAVYMAEVEVVCHKRLQRANIQQCRGSGSPWAWKFPSSSSNQDDAMQCQCLISEVVIKIQLHS